MVNTINSRKVAEMLGKAHAKLLRDIEGSKDRKGIIQVLGNDGFIESKYTDKKGEVRPCYEITHKGVKKLIDMDKSSRRIILQQIYEEMGGEHEEIICVDRFETTFFNKLSDTLKAMDIELEQQYNVLNYKLDGYLPQYNIAIEYDEGQHFVEPQKSLDIQRQQEIEKELNCKFIRLNYRDTDACNIGLVLKMLYKVNI